MPRTSRVFLKRAITALLCAVIFLAPLLDVARAYAATYPYDTVSQDDVNLRRYTNTSSVVLKKIPKGANVTVVGASGKYYKIKYDGSTGYAMKAYIDGTANAEETLPEGTMQPMPAAITDYPYDTTTRAACKLRKTAAADASVTTVLSKDAVVTVLSMSDDGGYVKVKASGKTGYIARDFVNLADFSLQIAVTIPTDSKDTTPAGAMLYTVLSKGATGDAVTALQYGLTELDYFSAKVDGVYGDKTLSAVKAFQKMNKLTQTGEADGQLQLLLYEGRPKNVRGNVLIVKVLSPLGNEKMQLNSYGPEVIKLHQRLFELGYYTGDIGETYTRSTVNAVKAFQRKMNLKADGVVGSDTRVILYDDIAISADATPTPTPAPTIAPPKDTVRKGDQSDDALRVQQRLQELGYYTGELDGKFGTSSVAALKVFQKKVGLNADGACGVQSASLLFAANAPSVSQSAVVVTPAPVITEDTAVGTVAPVYTPITAENVVVIQSGSTGEHVKRLQYRLQELGYYVTRGDGAYLESDIAAVKAFQTRNGLKADGKAGLGTQQTLYAVTALAAEAEDKDYSSADTTITLKYGDTGASVGMLQNRLIDLGFLKSGADSVYGVATKTAVIAFQRRNGLKRDGIAGSTTLVKLYSDEAVSSSDSTAATVLEQGANSQAVKDMQQRLIALGYLNSAADGKFGAATLAALVTFQKRNGLTADGIAGSITLEKLSSDSAKIAEGMTPTPKPTAAIVTTGAIKASDVRYGMWYSEVRARCKLYPYATVYDFTTGISWQVHMFSLGAHADSEPITAQDTANMNRAFGKTTWTAKAVWVVFSDGRIYMASTHNTPHGVNHSRTNEFAGHLCIHFPRTQEQVEAIGSYATSHQRAIDLGWQATLKRAAEER